MSATINEVLMEARGVGKRFGGVQALKDVSLTIRRNEIYGLIGPNGAGKTTFFNVLTGLYQRDDGDVLFEGNVLNLTSPHRSNPENAHCERPIRTFCCNRRKNVRPPIWICHRPTWGPSRKIGEHLRGNSGQKQRWNWAKKRAQLFA